MRLRLVVPAAMLVAALLSACEDDDPLDEPVAIPKLVGLDPFGLVAVPLGVKHTLEVKLVDDSGAPATGYQFEWMHERDNSGILTFEASSPEPGTERLTVVANFPRDTSVSVRLHGGTERSPRMWESPSTKLRFYGGDPVDLEPFHGTLELRVGEKRPTGAYPYAQVGKQRFLSDDPIACATADEAIATVDKSCVVTAVAAGSTTLTLRHGAATAKVPIVVAEGALGPPPVPFDADVQGKVAAGARAVRFEPGLTHESTLVHDARGYPRFVSETFPYSTANGWMAVLFAWTGSGFGIEQVSRRWESARDPQMAVDERGRIYVAYRDDRSDLLVLAERPGDGGPADWTYRHLDHELPEAAALGISARELREKNDTMVPALSPRPGGGVFLAFLDVTDAWHRSEVEQAVGAECVRRIRLVEVTDTSLVHQDVAEARHAVVSMAPQRCHHELAPPHTSRLLLLPPAAGSTTPRLLNLHPMGTDGLVRYEQQGGNWTEKVLVEPFQRVDGNVERPVYMTLVKPTPPGEEPQLAAIMQATSSFESVVEVPGMRQKRFSGGFDFDASTNDLRLFGFRNADHVWIGGSHLRKLARLSPFGGGMHFDDLFEREEAAGRMTVDDGREDVWGIHSDGETLDTVTDGPVYRRRRLTGPVAKPEGEPNGRGQRLSDGRRTARVNSAPVVLPDGTAYVHAKPIRFAEDDFDPEPETREPVRGQLLKASSADARFTELVRVDEMVDVALFRMERFWQVPGALVGLESLGAPDARWHRSTDGGKTWFEWGSISTAPPLGELVTPTGAAFVVVPAGEGYEVWFCPAIQDAPVFERIATTPATVLQTHDLVKEAQFFGFAIQGDRVHFASTLKQHNTRDWRIHVRTFALDGTEAGESFATLPSKATQNPRVDRMAATSTGHLLLQWNNLAVTGPDELWRIDPASGALEVGSIHGHRMPDLAFATLPDGRLAAAFSDRDEQGRLQARVSTSTDGLTWSTPVLLRADGGTGQKIGGIAATPDGRLLVVLGDNAALSSTLLGDRVGESSLPTNQLLGVPPVDYSILRVDAP